MARAGLTHGGFYAHFASKDALIGEAIGTMFDDARGRTVTMDSDDPRIALRAYIDFYLSAAHRDSRERGCPLPALSGDLARSNAAARSRFGTGVESLTTKLARVLEKLGQPHPAAEASTMLAQLVGALALSRAVGEMSQSDAILADTHAALVARYVLEPVQ
jgi:TetR/AcrR family transcriptional repressor of nem operon